ncbi:L-histidine N(alpha)-methyltransferase [soil metagenome]|nr:L-histidine N(alpha)-methyltransferase [Actinomycetota bacterium]MBA3565371.1 L-histidine N(alpha)-methyltransferase [Actinomycetota bacterium]MDQ3425705.1 L-histidine N(alpha)-methyltransferase [Actinomycetota bacterium]
MTERPLPPSRVRVDVLLDDASRRAALYEATLRSLTDTPKEISPIWLYDERGSRLFDEITHLPEYYLTRAERAILAERASEIASQTRAETLVELGSGTSEKTRLLLDALAAEGTLGRFVPLDVSEEVLVASAQEIADEYPGLEVHAVVADFERHLGMLPAGGRRLLAFLGSTIGGLEVDARERFLRTVASSLGSRDALLLGLDLVKDPARVEAAYSDGSGASERFQRNALAHLDRELGSDFSGSRFDYRPSWDPEREWMDIGFRSLEAQVVHIPRLGIEVAFADGEHLRTSVSSKFRRERFEADLAAADLQITRWWTDASGDFAVCLAVPSGSVNR